MPNNSATGGYLLPTSTTPLPGSLSLEDFIQTVLVGVTGFSGTLVRPKWQIEPPKQPDNTVNWIAFGIKIDSRDYNAYVQEGASFDSQQTMQRNEMLTVDISMYGPAALENYSAFSDAFEIQQNLEAMRAARMSFREVTDAVRVPDEFNGRWYNRYEFSLRLQRNVQRLYPVLPLVAASGIIRTVLQDDYESEWTAGEVE